MCDEQQLADMGQRFKEDRRAGGQGVNRRDFGRMGALATLAAVCAPGAAQAQGRLSEVAARFSAPGGTMDAYLVHPAQGKSPAVLVWPDGAGLRDAFMATARRLAREGYAVMVLNPYYADGGEAPQFEDFDDFREKNGTEKIGPWREKLTAPVVSEIGKAALAFLDKLDAVDTAKGVGVQGYCMGGAFAVYTAAAAPERVKAVASFHGGGLVGDADTAPVRLLGQTQASYLIAIARNDDARAPTDKDALKAVAQAAGRPAEIEVYRGDHGWMVVDSPAYEDEAAEKGWERLLNLYRTAL